MPRERDQLASSSPGALERVTTERVTTGPVTADSIRADIERARARLEASTQALKHDLGALERLTSWGKVVKDHPYITVAGAFAVGVLVGALFSRSDDGTEG